MAVDTAEKRFMMMNFVSGFGVHNTPNFEPDGTVDADDRAHLMDLYGGNAFDIPAVAMAVLGSGGATYRRRRRIS